MSLAVSLLIERVASIIRYDSDLNRLPRCSMTSPVIYSRRTTCCNVCVFSLKARSCPDACTECVTQVRYELGLFHWPLLCQLVRDKMRSCTQNIARPVTWSSPFSFESRSRGKTQARLLFLFIYFTTHQPQSWVIRDPDYRTTFTDLQKVDIFFRNITGK